MLLSELPQLFERLSKPDQSCLVGLLVQQVVVDQTGSILEVRLNAPFAYLNDLAQAAAGRQSSRHVTAVLDDVDSSAQSLGFSSQANRAQVQALMKESSQHQS